MPSCNFRDSRTRGRCQWQNRLDMELTGIKTPVGMKIQGPDLDRIQEIGAQIQQDPLHMPDDEFRVSLNASRRGFTLNVEVNRPSGTLRTDRRRTCSALSRSEIGGANIARERRRSRALPDRSAIRARLPRQSGSAGRALIGTPTGAQIPINEVARVYSSRGSCDDS